MVICICRFSFPSFHLCCYVEGVNKLCVEFKLSLSINSPLVELFTLVMGLDYCCVTLVTPSETQGQLVGWKGFLWARVYRLTAPGSPRML